MKVDGIALLQMIKNGEIKDKTKIYCNRFDKYSGIYIIYEDKELNIYDRRGRYEEENKFGVISSTDLLDYKFEIEIIEEDKPIEELDLIEKINNDLNFANNYSKNNMKNNMKYVANKINELIDKVNELKKENE